LILTLILCFYLGIYRNKIFFKKIFIIFFIIFSIISVTTIGNNLIYYLEKDFINAEIERDINYIFVPAGGKDRLITAIRIKNSYNLINTKIIYSTGIPYLDKKNSQDDELQFTKNLIANSKIEKKDIIFLPEARNTLENFTELNKYLIKTDEKDSKILLITHGYHLKRSIMLANKHKLNVYPFSSQNISSSNANGLINTYQKFEFIGNLRMFDVFSKELISIFFSYFFVNVDN
jgi:uncharacterized SAM-binding protein YcdF (DUF218 family)